jgi:hypothetical protein
MFEEFAAEEKIRAAWPSCCVFRHIASARMPRRCGNCVLTAQVRIMLALENKFGIERGETRIFEMTGYATIRPVVGDLRAANA